MCDYITGMARTRIKYLFIITISRRMLGLMCLLPGSLAADVSGCLIWAFLFKKLIFTVNKIWANNKQKGWASSMQRNCKNVWIKTNTLQFLCCLPTTSCKPSHLCSFPRESPTVFFTSSFPGLSTWSFKPANPPKGIVACSLRLFQKCLGISLAHFLLRKGQKNPRNCSSSFLNLWHCWLAPPFSGANGPSEVTRKFSWAFQRAVSEAVEAEWR